MIARAALLVAAVATAVWLAGALPGVRAKARGRDIAARATPQLARAEVDRAVDEFDRARRRQPDGGVVPAEAGFLIRVGRRDEAAALLRPLVRDEPRNVTAWALLSLALARSDPAAANRARARARALAPPVR